jgi:O-antigen/teichoic acid export membrane protein
MQRLREPLFANSVANLANQLLFAIVGMVFWLIAAHLYSAQDVGIGSAAYSAMIVVSYFSLLGLDYSLMRFLPNSGERANGLINLTFLIGGIASLAISGIFVAGIRIWTPALISLQQNIGLCVAFVVFTAGWTWYWLAGRVCMGKSRAIYALAQGGIFNILRVVLIVLLAGLAGHFGIFLAWGISGIVAFLIGIAVFVPKAQPGYRVFSSFPRQLLGTILRYSLSNYAVSLFWFGSLYLMPLIIVNALGEEANAYFFISWQFVNILFAISIATSFALLVEGSQRENNLEKNVGKTLTFTFLLTIPAVLLVILCGGWLLQLFGASYAEHGLTMLRFGALSAIPVSFNQVYFAAKRVDMKMRGVIFFNALTFFGSLVLSYFLSRKMGITGAGVAWLSVHGIASLWIAAVWLHEIRGKKSKIETAIT